MRLTELLKLSEIALCRAGCHQPDECNEALVGSWRNGFWRSSPSVAVFWGPGQLFLAPSFAMWGLLFAVLRNGTN